MSLPPLPPDPFEGPWGRVAAAVGSLIFIISILLVTYLWVQDSENPPPGSDLPQPVIITPTPQFPTPPGGVSHGG